jgi:DNA-binding winged helix-turn-helix (wHTH) protein
MTVIDMSPQPESIYEFDSFRLDRRGLSREGVDIHLRPKVVDLLRILIERRNDLCSKKDLMDRLWPDEMVEEAGLTNNVSTLRKVLGRNKNGKEYIKTHHRRGYSLIADVTVRSESGAIDGEPSHFQRHGNFSEFMPFFPPLIEGATEITLFFIHSRRWRENHRESLLKFLGREGTKLSVFLPHLEDDDLFRQFDTHFEDGRHIPNFILDAYQDFARLALKFKNKVIIRRFNLYPVYSFYQFDGTLIVAMYPNTRANKGVPAFQFTEGGKFWDFVQDDVQRLSENSPLSEEELLQVLER